MNKADSVFSNFTNQYSLSKTLKFELKPHPLTKSLVEVVNKDKEIDRLSTKEMKPMLDALHEKFITESLEKMIFSISDLEQLERHLDDLKVLRQKLKNLNNNKDKKKKEIDSIQKEIKNLEDKKSGKIPKLQQKLRQVIVDQINEIGDEWKEIYTKEGIKFEKDNGNKKKQGYEMLTTKGVLGILKSEYSQYPEKIKAISEFDQFFTYFKGLNDNRANYYTDEQKATGVANRIINVNLNIFLKNKNDFSLFLEKLPQLKDYETSFALSNFQKCLAQADIEAYNEKVGEVKKLVNLEYNQKVADKKDLLKGLNKLQKQIGCKIKQEREQLERGESIYPKYLEKVGLGFHITKTSDDKYQIWESLDYLNDQLIPQVKKLKDNYESFFENWQDYKLNEIWFRRESLNTISGRWFGGNNWFVLTKALAYFGTGKMNKGEYKPDQFISLLELKEAMEALENGVDFDIKKPNKKTKEGQTEAIKDEITKQYFYKPENLFRDKYKDIYKNKTLFVAFLTIWRYELKHRFKEIEFYLDDFNIQKKTPFDKGNKEHVKTVFNLMQEGYLPILQMTKYHSLEKKSEIVPGYNTENKFYETLNDFWEDNPINQYRSAFEATLTQKPYSEDKIKLNFDCGSLLGGWSPTYEAYGSLIFKKDNRFYLVLIKGTGLSDEEMKGLYQSIDRKNSIERLIYNAQKLDFKNCPRWFINSIGDSKAPAVKKYNLPVESIWEDYQIYRKLDKNGKDKYLEDNKNFRFRLIDYYKHCLPFHESLKEFKGNFSWKDTKDYNNLNEFYTDAVNSCYKISWENINFDALKRLVRNERIYLFQIYNKDFEIDTEIGEKKYGESYNTKEKLRKAQGNPKGVVNLHTQLFFELLKPENIKYLKLMGGGEIFFREPSKEKSYRFDTGRREVLKAKRYYEEKYFLHFPVEIKKTKESSESFNQKIYKTLTQNHKPCKIIGIDRGEKHLLYYSVISINESGGTKIEDQGSLNRVKTKSPVDEKKLECEYDEKGKLQKVDLVSTGKKVNYVDYHLLLDYYEKKRNLARKSWEVIGKIKDLKEGYLSQVIYKI
ncbi:hypothetical protein COV25_03855, partial [candidate division WWE3 bacterium CG10_big_fil_rev_8_21_14_0_10_35_32]